MSKPEIRVSEEEEQEFATFLNNKIKAFNNNISPHHRAARQPGAVTPLNIILQDSDGNMVGGLTASTYWGWLDIDDFYIPEAYRGQGIGSALLKQAEAIAIERGCQRSFLSTFAFQARAFYEKQGYYVTGTLEDYPPGSAMYWMRKALAQD